MKIGLLYAMPVEIRGLLKNADAEPMEVISGVPFYQVSENIIAACGGVGKVNIAMAAELLCFHFKVDLVINAGLAGGCADLPIGTLVLGSDCVQHDMDTSAIGDPVGLVSGINKIYFESDPRAREILLSAAESLGLKACLGRIASGDKFIASGEDKSRIITDFAADACEMEGCAIAQVAFVNGTPFAVVRALSDSADGEATMDYPTFLPIAARNSTNMTLALIREW